MKSTFLLIWVSWAGCIAAAPQQSAMEASIRGHVYDSHFGLAVPKASVRIVSTGSAKSALSDQQGHFEFRNLVEGQYTISVESLGFARSERTVQVTAREHVQIDIPLRVGHLHDPLRIEIIGTARLTDKRVAANVAIVAMRPFDQQVAAKTSTNRAGHYRLRLDDPGQYVIYAFKSGYKVKAFPMILRAKLPRERYRADIILSPFRQH